MNFKLIVGIFVPLLIIITLIILGSSKIGFSISEENAESVAFSSVFPQLGGSQEEVVIQTITITNDFFLPRRYELSRVAVCFRDKENPHQGRRDYLEVQYSEGTYLPQSDVPVFNKLLVKSWRSASSGNIDIATSIELPRMSKKKIKIILIPKEFYVSKNSTSVIQQILPYKNYEELLLIKPQNNARHSYLCENLGNDELNSAIHIPIIGKEAMMAVET